MDSRKTCVSECYTLHPYILLRRDFALVAGAGKSIFWYILFFQNFCPEIYEVDQLYDYRGRR